MENDWDLMAIVRSCSKIKEKSNIKDPPSPMLGTFANCENASTKLQEIPVNGFNIYGLEMPQLPQKAPSVQPLPKQAFAPLPRRTPYDIVKKEKKRKCRKKSIKMSMMRSHDKNNQMLINDSSYQSTKSVCHVEKHMKKLILDSAVSIMIGNGEHNHLLPKSHNKQAGVPHGSVNSVLLNTSLNYQSAVQEKDENDNSNMLLSANDFEFSWDPNLYFLIDEDKDDDNIDGVKNPLNAAGSSSSHFNGGI